MSTVLLDGKVPQYPDHPSLATAERRLIVNADNFGRSPGINRGIISAYEAGIVTSASLMVRWPAALDAATYARANPLLSVGLQLDLGEWAYLGGEWVRVYEVVPPGDESAVREEVERQLERFRELVGRDPLHLDSYQDAHLREPVGAVLRDAARALGVTLRQCSPGVGFCGEFYGQTSRGEPLPDLIDVEHLLGILRTLPPGLTELRCHPGQGNDCGTPYGPARGVELDALCDPRVLAAVTENGVALCSFADVPSGSLAEAPSREKTDRERGHRAFVEGKFREAELWFRRAVATYGSRPWAWLWLSRAQLKLKNLPGSLVSVERALELYTDWPAALWQKADVLAELGDRSGAIALLEGSLLSHREDADVLRAGLQRLLKVKAYSAAADAADLLLRLHAHDEDALCAKAVALWKSGSPAAARRLIESALDAPTPHAARALSQLYLEAGEAMAAWEMLEPVEAAALNPQLLKRLGLALRNAGHLGAARAALARGLELEPQNALLRHWNDVVAGEIRVVTGRWAPPVIDREPLRPVPGRVLHLVGKSPPHAQTGYTVRTHFEALSQRGVGLDPQVVTQLGFPWDQGVETPSPCDVVEGIHYHRISPDGGNPAPLDERLSRNVELLADVVRQLRPSVLQPASDYRNAMLGLALRDSFGLPVVYTVRGFWEETWLSKQSRDARDTDSYLWRRERELHCMQQADRIITLAEVMKKQIVERGVPEERVVVIPNAVDTDVFVPVGRDPTLARRLGVRLGEVVLGYISSFVAYEGIRYLIEAVARLRSRGYAVRGLLVGDGEERGELEAVAADCGVRDHVIFTGRVTHAEVLRYYGMIDVFVVPRTADKVSQLVTPLKPYEAMAAGRAVVVSDGEALREMVVEGETGLVFRAEDSTHLADVVEPLLGDVERRQSLGRGAREWVCENRTWRQNGERFLALYEEMGVTRGPSDGQG